MSTVTNLKPKQPTARELLTGIKVIDVDTHVSEWHDLWTSRAPASLKSRVPRFVNHDGKGRWVIDEDIFIAGPSANSAITRDGQKLTGMAFIERRLGDAHEGAYDVGARVRYMDEMGVFAQIAYPNVLGFSGQRAMQVDEELRVASIEIFNDAMAQMQRDSGERIYPMALLPWWDVRKAVKETERCHAMGMRGVNINPDPHEHGLPSIGHPSWDPLWEACSALDMPVNFHIGASDASMSWFASASWPERTPDERLALGGVMLFVGNLRVMANILMSRFLERFPHIKIVSVESGGGWAPYLLEALDYMSRESGLKIAIPFKEIFRRQIYVCSFFERDNLVETIRQVGADNILFESDFPHPACLYPEALEYLAAPAAAMTADERFKFFSGNAAKLYNIDISRKVGAPGTSA
jgi:predicted TIM-barrel fold metal-dependent hydrolase